MEAVRALSGRYDFVFTSGGIGPTHDDITADSVAKAFGLAIDVDQRAVDLLMPFWKGRGIEPNEARLRMARIPEGAELIPNSVSAAPGFVVENVFVMAGRAGDHAGDDGRGGEDAAGRAAASQRDDRGASRRGRYRRPGGGGAEGAIPACGSAPTPITTERNSRRGWCCARATRGARRGDSRDGDELARL